MAGAPSLASLSRPFRAPRPGAASKPGALPRADLLMPLRGEKPEVLILDLAPSGLSHASPGQRPGGRGNNEISSRHGPNRGDSAACDIPFGAPRDGHPETSG